MEPLQTGNDRPVFPEPSTLSAGLRCRCPHCGRGRLFDGFLTLAPRCEVCGLDYSTADSADGPAYFVMSIVGFIVTGLALWTEFTYQPSLWLHLALWFPLTVGLCLVLIRPAKGLMIAVQHRHKAREERFL